MQSCTFAVYHWKKVEKFIEERSVHYCAIHRQSYEIECSSCRAEGLTKQVLRQLELSHEEALQRQDESENWLAFKSANPGDYDCPHCRYRTLKLQASRCPKCHGEVSSHFWSKIAEAKAENARAAEKHRAAEAARQTLIQEQDRALNLKLQEAYRRLPWWRKLSKGTRENLLIVYFGYIVPVATLFCIAIRYPVEAKIDSWWEYALILLPGINIPITALCAITVGFRVKEGAFGFAIYVVLFLLAIGFALRQQTKIAEKPPGVY